MQYLRFEVCCWKLKNHRIILDKQTAKKLKTVFDLSLKIEGANLDHSHSSKSIHVYKFPDNTNPTPSYEFQYRGWYGDWLEHDHPESLDSLIKKLTDHIKTQK